MSLSCGIIGLPNVGKSTIFKLLTKLQVETKNFPFCTIKPNIGILPIKDIRINQLSNIVQTKKITPNTIKIIDIAGLVKGSHKGEGLGNQFLNNIRETTAIMHVVRCFKNENITHIYSSVNPNRDIEIINTELILSEIKMCERIIKLYKNKNINDFKLNFLKKCLNHLNNFKMLRFLKMNLQEKKFINEFNFITLKPFMYIANINKEKNKNNKYINEVKKIAKKENAYVVEIYAKNKSNYKKLIKNKKNNKKIILNKSLTNIEKIINFGFKLLKLQTFFTVGSKEIKAWSLPIGSSILEASKKIHTDIAKGFIKAEVISFKDFINYNGYKQSKKFNKVRYEGKNYLVKDGDIINILFNN
ncbi:redox-regulated ATPase YchF [Sodalis-like secondary symbiont of Drepanosiphum platanoidis]|uniref:redox-regulated ATPase YchF n=1 Tax=Sodalis-like secondary symbiont of Drepanosiphum platanoidis TaxID=2994493 RepID=UPI003463AD40